MEAMMKELLIKGSEGEGIGCDEKAEAAGRTLEQRVA